MTTRTAGEVENDKVILHDPATVMYMMEPQCFYSRKVFCNIELNGRYSYGMTVLDLENVLHKDEAEKNVDYVYAKPECADYLAEKFFEYIRNAV